MILKDHGTLTAHRQIGRLLYYVFVGVRFVNEPHPYIMIRYKVTGTPNQGVRVAMTQEEMSTALDALVQEYGNATYTPKSVRLP
jgi:hypothetical protein